MLVGKKLYIAIIVSLVLFVGCSSDTKTLSVKPSKAQFGDVFIDESLDIELTLTNKYGKDITITNLTITGSSDVFIKSGSGTPITLLKGAEHKVTLTYAPTNSGQIIAYLQIDHDASTKLKEIEITGNGVPAPRIQISETNYDFDKKLINKGHDHDFEIKNIGTADMTISNFSFTGTGASAYSISAGNAPVNIQPGTTHTFTVTFTPTVLGNFPADLAISHSAVNEISPLTVSLTGEGIDLDPRITLSVGSSWDFGSVAKTIPSTQLCEIENTGIDPLTVSSATLTTGAEFVIDSLTDSNGNPLNFPQTIAVGAKIFLYIKFSPTANTNYNDTLSFVHDGTNELSPFDIPLSGIGRDEISKKFSYTGAAQQWTVPAGVTSIVVECYGAEGGPSQYGSLPGKGGLAKAKIPVTPGDTLNIYVGGKGSTQKAASQGGWNGGGGTNSTFSSYFPGTGGGASDIRIGGATLADRKIVGAGGGGGGHSNYSPNGGAGGGLTGDNGTSSSSSFLPGKGGTQSAGGASGGSGATAGTIGVGGMGKGNASGGGGGGGGYYGGGGGYIASGGGGSSYYDAPGNTDKSTTKGARSGDGEIEIKY